MSIVRTTFSLFSKRAGAFRAGSMVTLLAFLGIAAYAILDTHAHSNGLGITGSTQKSGNSGCSCHCSSASSSTSATVANSSPPTSYQTGQAYTLTLSASNSGESGAGCDIAVKYGSLSVITGSGLQLDQSSGELTHTAPKTGTSVSWNFTYTAPSTPCDDTIYATANAVNLDNSEDPLSPCTDKWNFAPKFIIHVVAPARGITVSSSQLNVGNVRVGSRKFATTTVQGTGVNQITINSTAMKSGAQFATNSTNGVGSRTMNPLATETDTVFFSPSARGSFTDSLIINTNSDTVAKQRVAVAATGQGIQAIFNNSLSTLAFGNVKLAFAAPKMSFIYSNTGDDTLFLTQPTITGSAYSISRAPNKLALPPGGTDSVVVLFSPTARQAYTGSLSFSASNGVSAPTISLSGTGVEPLLQANASSAIGNVKVGQPLQGIYSVKNIGNDTMHITLVSLNPATGSRFTLGTYDATLLPNATGTFHLTYTPTVEKTDSVQLKFTTDDPAAVNFTALITAAGVLPHMTIDTTTTDVGQTKVGSPLTHDFAVVNNGGSDLTMNVALEGDPAFTILTAPQSVQAGATGYVSVKFLPTATGTFNAQLLISGDDASNPRDTIHMTGSGVNSALTITPANAAFNYVPVGVTMYDTLKLSNSGAATVKILSYKLTGSPAFKVIDTSTHQVAASGTGRIIVSFRPTDISGLNGTLTLTTDEATPTRTIALSGAGVKGALTPLPIVLDFGTVDTGLSKTLSSTLKNTGTGPITASTITLDAPAEAYSFTATPNAPVTVQPNDSIVLSVTFAPHAAQTFSGGIKLTTSDGTTGDIITFVGVGHLAQNNGVAKNTIAGLHLSLVPNPAHSAAACMLTLDEPQTLRMLLIDALGRQVVAQNLGMLSIGDHQIDLPISQLASGTYFVRLISETGSMETKLVIEN